MSDKTEKRYPLRSRERDQVDIDGNDPSDQPQNLQIDNIVDDLADNLQSLDNETENVSENADSVLNDRTENVDTVAPDHNDVVGLDDDVRHTESDVNIANEPTVESHRLSDGTASAETLPTVDNGEIEISKEQNTLSMLLLLSKETNENIDKIDNGQNDTTEEIKAELRETKGDVRKAYAVMTQIHSNFKALEQKVSKLEAKTEACSRKIDRETKEWGKKLELCKLEINQKFDCRIKKLNDDMGAQDCAISTISSNVSQVINEQSKAAKECNDKHEQQLSELENINDEQQVLSRKVLQIGAHCGGTTDAIQDKLKEFEQAINQFPDKTSAARAEKELLDGSTQNSIEEYPLRSRERDQVDIDGNDPSDQPQNLQIDNIVDDLADNLQSLGNETENVSENADSVLNDRTENVDTVAPDHNDVVGLDDDVRHTESDVNIANEPTVESHRLSDGTASAETLPTVDNGEIEISKEQNMLSMLLLLLKETNENIDKIDNGQNDTTEEIKAELRETKGDVRKAYAVMTQIHSNFKALEQKVSKLEAKTEACSRKIDRETKEWGKKLELCKLEINQKFDCRIKKLNDDMGAQGCVISTISSNVSQVINEQSKAAKECNDKHEQQLSELENIKDEQQRQFTPSAPTGVIVAAVSSSTAASVPEPSSYGLYSSSDSGDGNVDSAPLFMRRLGLGLVKLYGYY
ncbi:ELKS/Rab6-interacting/CAST family member 1-like [Schistocerca nitens]|uniref:ELKS/Rab6-interacting/CAST family member 1-like n=1 Tax=Schistocerca nitens TaxID=7011 RepID=UPI002117CB92|nr:ELKS/Rab6-interacting/CAST family member 1-like [Schistocerca nitens]